MSEHAPDVAPPVDVRRVRSRGWIARVTALMGRVPECVGGTTGRKRDAPIRRATHHCLILEEQPQ